MGSFHLKPRRFLIFLSSPLAKNIPLRRTPKSTLSFPLSHPLHEGRIAIVTDVGMGCGGRDSVVRAIVIAGRFYRERSERARRAAMLRTVKSCGSGIRC